MLNQLIAAYNAWRYNISNILSSFEHTKRRLANASRFHNKTADAHFSAAESLKTSGDKHRAFATKAISVHDKIEALLS